MPSQSPNLPVHAAAGVFPELTGAAYRALVEDIRAHGLLEPIVLVNGEVLDGRTRLRACADLAIVPRFETYTGDSPTSFVVSMNVHRRHLTDDQRAAVAAELAPLFAAEAKMRQQAAGKEHGRGKPKVPPKSGEAIPHAREAPAQAGATVGVSRSRTERAAKVKKARPQLFEQVKAGAVTLARAERQIVVEDARRVDAAISDAEHHSLRLKAAYLQAECAAFEMTNFAPRAVADTMGPADRTDRRRVIGRLRQWFGEFEQALDTYALKAVR